jgi:hypothetical protein
MFYRTENAGLRLYRPGDPAHPARRGKTHPSRADLPAQYHDLLDWYESVYCKGGKEIEEDDPILRLRGLGRHLWAGTDPDDCGNGLRSGWNEEFVARPQERPRVTTRDVPGDLQKFQCPSYLFGLITDPRVTDVKGKA